jgi:hypothetical protein
VYARGMAAVLRGGSAPGIVRTAPEARWRAAAEDRAPKDTRDARVGCGAATAQAGAQAPPKQTKQTKQKQNKENKAGADVSGWTPSLRAVVGRYSSFANKFIISAIFIIVGVTPFLRLRSVLVQQPFFIVYYYVCC